jgi:Uma2 family endonuclease
MAVTTTIPGVASEHSSVLHDVRWATYEALLADRGDHGPRMFYDEGTLEIMSPSRRHERLKVLIGRLIEAYSEELMIEISAAGATTLRSQLRRRGLEPDASYYIKHEGRVRNKDDIDLAVDPPPDLAVEVDITSKSVDKLATYSSLGVPELWSHDGARLVVRVLDETGSYAVAERSKSFPDLPLDELNRFLEQRATLSDTRIGRAFRAWVTSRLGTG